MSYIDPDKCRMCRKCEAACPTGAIVAVNFPPRKPKDETASAKKLKDLDNSTDATVQKVVDGAEKENMTVGSANNFETKKEV